MSACFQVETIGDAYMVVGVYPRCPRCTPSG